MSKKLERKRQKLKHDIGLANEMAEKDDQEINDTLTHGHFHFFNDFFKELQSMMEEYNKGDSCSSF